jgi:hypothetical protein
MSERDKTERRNIGQDRHTLKGNLPLERVPANPPLALLG